MDEKLMNLSLEDKILKSKEVIREAVNRYSKVATAWTGGKDSTVLLHLIKEAFDGVIPIPVVFVDTGKHFQEVYQFRDEFVKKWGLTLINAKNLRVLTATKSGTVALKDLPDAMKADLKKIGWVKNKFRIALDREPCCHLLKTVATNQAIIDHKLDALMAGIRWDEQEARSEEKFFSPRTDPPHVRIHPLLHFKWKDVWEYMKMYNIPHNPLYDKGFTSLGCYTCTSPNPEGKVERAGRSQDKEQTMRRLRELGYF